MKMRSPGFLKVAILLGTMIFSGSAMRSQTPERTSGPAEAMREVSGTIVSIDGSKLVIKDRTGKIVQVDAAAAQQKSMTVPLVVDRAVEVKGTSDAHGVIHAQIILRAKGPSSMWPADN